MDLIKNSSMLDWKMDTVQGHNGDVLVVSCTYTDSLSEKHTADIRFEMSFLKDLVIKFIDFLYSFLSKNFKKIFNI